MRRVGCSLALLALSLAGVRAQVTVEVVQDQDQFLPGETVRTAVRVTNLSGQTLKLGEEDDWLKFWVESGDGLMVAKVGETPVKGEFEVGSSEVATKRVDLLPYFALSKPGRYSVSATVRIKQWDREISSQPRTFFLIDGAKLWEQEFGVPNASGPTNAAPEVRKYILQQANYIKGQLRLYLRLTDGAGKPIRVFAIGGMVSFSRPEPHVDKFSNLHVLYANGARSYGYTRSEERRVGKECRSRWSPYH